MVLTSLSVKIHLGRIIDRFARQWQYMDGTFDILQSFAVLQSLDILQVFDILQYFDIFFNIFQLFAIVEIQAKS